MLHTDGVAALAAVLQAGATAEAAAPTHAAAGVTIISIAPSGNLAELIRRFPTTIPSAAGVVAMAGSIASLEVRRAGGSTGAVLGQC